MPSGPEMGGVHENSREIIPSYTIQGFVEYAEQDLYDKRFGIVVFKRIFGAPDEILSPHSADGYPTEVGCKVRVTAEQAEDLRESEGKSTHLTGIRLEKDEKDRLTRLITVEALRLEEEAKQGREPAE